MILFSRELGPGNPALAFLAGAAVGWLVDRWNMALTLPAPAADPFLAGVTGNRLRHRFWRGGLLPLVTGLLFAVYVLAAARFHCQQIDEVRPDDFSRDARIVYHLVLISLLTAATATDLRAYLIPDAITIPGTLFGIAAATASGQLQMVHLWVDWNQEVPGIAGPFIPAWLDAHRHLHGLAWSVSGALAGASLTAAVRSLSSWILRRESLGFGDVTLMAMIGSYVGWQPVLFVFALAPLCGLLGLLPLRLILRGPYVPYGPFLAAGTYVVLLLWRRLWQSTRLIFGDVPSLLVLGAAAAIGLVVLLVLLRLFGRGFPGANTEPDEG